jgi:hypothetical protein
VPHARLAQQLEEAFHRRGEVARRHPQSHDPAHRRVGAGIDGFFREVAPIVGEGEKPGPTMPDNELFATRMLHYGIELVGPPPTL